MLKFYFYKVFGDVSELKEVIDAAAAADNGEVKSTVESDVNGADDGILSRSNYVDETNSDNNAVKQDDPPFTVLSGNLNSRENSVETINGGSINGDAIKPYFYDKPTIPFEFDKQPEPNEKVETFDGYEYPKPNVPFPPSTGDGSDGGSSTTESFDLPPASARIIDGSN